jgi:hypothetical protein
MQHKISLWIGVLAGIVIVSILFIPEVSPIIDNPRFFKMNFYVYLVKAGVIVGLVGGNGIKDGGKTGFLAGTIGGLIRKLWCFLNYYLCLLIKITSHTKNKNRNKQISHAESNRWTR